MFDDRTKKIIRIIMISIIVLGVVAEISYKFGKDSAYTNELKDGLIQGFDEGFISGSQFGIGASVGFNNQTAWDNGSWYYWQGYNYTTIPDYVIPNDTNPYRR